jgi:hypothetical protein
MTTVLPTETIVWVGEANISRIYSDAHFYIFSEFAAFLAYVEVTDVVQDIFFPETCAVV